MSEGPKITKLWQFELSAKSLGHINETSNQPWIKTILHTVLKFPFEHAVSREEKQAQI